MKSSRLPGKVLLPLAGKPALERMIERVKRSKYVDEIIVATTVNDSDDPIVALSAQLGVSFFRGSEEDVLSRVLGAAQSRRGDIIVELTGDCPLMDWRLVDRGIEEFFNNNVDYSSNTIKLSYPDGFDVKVFPTEVLAQVDKLTDDAIDRVHVSYYIYTHPDRFKLHNWEPEPELFWPDLRVTLDEQGDYELINIIFTNLLRKDEDFTAKDVVDFLRNNPKLLNINKYVRTKSPVEG